MEAEVGQEVQDPHSDQQQLAEELVACLGRDGAIHVCKVNGWAGVLELIQNQHPCAAE